MRLLGVVESGPVSWSGAWRKHDCTKGNMILQKETSMITGLCSMGSVKEVFHVTEKGTMSMESYGREAFRSVKHNITDRLLVCAKLSHKNSDRGGDDTVHSGARSETSGER